VAAGGHVVLIGLMGSGKTTIGSALAARLHRPFVDNDEALTGRYGHTAREIESAAGFDTLHRDESEVLCRALADPTASVIAAAAGAVPEPGVADALRAHTVVYLRASPTELARRVESGPGDGHRPFGTRAPLELLSAQFSERDAEYSSVASLVVDTGSRSPDEIVDAIARVVARP
jgi:shikimate kinase